MSPDAPPTDRPAARGPRPPVAPATDRRPGPRSGSGPRRTAPHDALTADRSTIERARTAGHPRSAVRPAPRRLTTGPRSTARPAPARRHQPPRPGGRRRLPTLADLRADWGRTWLRPGIVLVVLALIAVPSLFIGGRVQADIAGSSRQAAIDAAVGAAPIVPSDADELVATLAAEAPVDVPDATISIAAVPVDGDALVAVSGGDRLVKSASTAKAWFAAAALEVNAITAVEPYAHDTFADSSDFAAGHLIDLAGGPDAINRFTHDRVGMVDTGLVRWVGEETVRADDVDDRLDSSNYTTVPDMALFLRKLARGELLDPPRTAALLEWMRMSPRDQGVDEYGGRLPDQLPPAVQADVSHKAGWLFPEGGDDFWLLDFGIVYPPSGEAYVFVVAGNTSADYAQLKDFVGRASCLAYRALGDDPGWRCPAASVNG